MFIARHRASGQDFTRDRKLTFSRLVTLLLNQLKCALQNELDHFFQVLGVAEFGQRFVTAAALSKARKKLKASAFIELNEKSLDIFQKQFPNQKKWFCFRLLAVDGSKVELPDKADVRAHFGTESHHRPMGLLSTLYDLNHRLWLDANLTPLAKGERANAVDHLAHTQEGDLLLYDRGYPAFWLMALHHSLNRHFCMRLPFNFHEEASDFFLSEEAEKTVVLKPGKPAEALCQEHDLPTDALRLRLIRVPLESGEQEILITSLLDRERYPARIFKDLYHRRWGQEEGYKHLKIHAELQNWTGRGLHAVLQDLHSKRFLAVSCG